jgi:hypothetical protein
VCPLPQRELCCQLRALQGKRLPGASTPALCCTEYKNCAYPRLSYRAELAQKRADSLLVTSRQGADLTEDEAALIYGTAKPLLENGLSPAAIWAEHGDKMPCSERSFYRYVKNGHIDGIIVLDLPKAAGYKQRRQGRATTRTNISQEALGGRTYADFLLLPDSVRANAAEMDCVIGAVGDECCLLTLFFRQWAFSPSSFCQGTQPGLWCGSCLI